MLRRVIGLVCLLLSGLSQAGFILGVPPIHSTRTLVQTYEPLRTHLAAKLGHPVYLESAAHFVAFHGRVMRQDFDFTITPAHFARLAEKDQGFRPLAQFRPDHDALLIHATDRPLPGLDALRGQSLAVIDRLAITSMAAMDFLENRGLEADQDYKVMEYRNHASVAQALVSGLALAGVTTTQGLRQMPEALRSRIKVHTHIADIPAFVILAKPGLTARDAARLREIILTFLQGDAGQAFLQAVAYTGASGADEASLRRADAYLTRTRKALAQ